MLYIAKDVHETLDYTFIYGIADPIVSVSYTQPEGATLVVQSCYTNVVEIEDDQGVTYPPNQAIILWVSGGTLDTSEKLRITYTTTAGRVLDEDITFRFVAEN